MKKINIFILLFLCFYIAKSQSTTTFNCNYNWTTDNPIYAQKNPFYSSTIKVKNGEKTTVSLTFSDADTKKAIKSDVCPKGGKILAQGNSPKYKISLSITQKNSYASLTNLNSPSITNISIMKVGNDAINKFTDNTFQYQLIIPVWFFDTWNNPQNKNDKVKLTYTITDETTLPNGDTGNLSDSPMTGNWTFILDDSPNPTVMINLPDNPESNTWLENKEKIEFQYAVGQDLNNDKKSDYEEKIVREELYGPYADNMFTLADLKSTWLVQNLPNATTEQEVVDFIFNPPFGGAFSWQIGDLTNIHQDALYKKDSHGKIPDIAADKVFAAFKGTPYKEGKAGYRINQTFFCGNTPLGTTIINKKLVYSLGATLDYLKKVHNF